MSSNSRIKVYFTYDTEDSELVKLWLRIFDYIGVFEVFLSPFEILGQASQLDSERMNAVLNCDVVIALFTRRSRKSIIIKSEVKLAKMNDKLVLPLVDTSSTVPKIVHIIGNLKQIHFFKNHDGSIISAIKRIFSTIHLLQNRYNFPNEALENGEKAIRR
jgi:hypothetical protein